MAVHEGADVDDNFFADIDAAFDGRRSETRHQHDLAGARELDQLGIDRGLMLENVKACAGDVAGFIRRANAFSSMTSPRAVLTIKASGCISFKRRADKR